MAKEKEMSFLHRLWYFIGAWGAAFLSYSLNGSFWWAVFHFLCNWIYILYALFFRFKDIRDWVQSL